MFKRNLVLGGLIAGAFVLPSLAVAGSVSGVCSNCHTMHNSQAGVAMLSGLANGAAAQPMLLAGTGCVGCHASADDNNSSGKPTGAGKAPQVDNNGTSGYVLNGGYFTKVASGADSVQHNVVGITTHDGTLSTAPGGSLATVGFTCESCHTAQGHHKTATNKYRMLEGTNATIGQTSPKDYGAVSVATAKVGTRSEVIYNATAMNGFCAGCHATFHNSAEGTGTWTRHPTDVAVVVNGSSSTSIVNYYNNADTDSVVVGYAGATKATTPTAAAATINATVMCISCHVPHGGPYADLLSFNYTLVTAGSNAAGLGGCEKCHSYSGAGM